ncbi:MAG: VOC family protein [Bacteroidetes bacterium]|nr:VOC family protein [Bacteroidota bacterium]
MENIISWFEIPAHNLDRAKKFYQSILGLELKDGGFGSDEMAFFPSDLKNVSGAIVKGEHRRPHNDGVLVYLNGGNNLNNILSKVNSAGGKVLVEKTLILPEAGYFGIFFDTEGNQIGIHSIN